ncbi:hypothetical protein BBOV_I000260 [Babesia bovis T2Bo]|uniref:Uncharacterized protein n=1 Tax=Babesia bovis TaxID=5865 RepID=A7AX47_BABBO|nr:hypothetical protein BBOV_I000260 [Babesia bovis T2Bo]EDO05120.1 hypothetical protein BBOV_I000260 [Babesia bovis T2Bo]|eukprot:XP_001608688.1 hypothetical protein [Babesia bovis T2Bo]
MDNRMETDAFYSLRNHIRYMFHRSPQAKNAIHYDSKVLRMKFNSILSNRGNEASKILASDLVNICSRHNIKKCLKLCSCSLRDRTVSPTSKINAMQLVVIIALSNDYNAYLVARSKVLEIVARIGDQRDSPSRKSLLGGWNNAVQLSKCINYANAIIETLSKIEVFDLTLHQSLPFGVMCLLSQCNQLRLQQLAIGSVPLNHLTSNRKPSDGGSYSGSARENYDSAVPKSYRTRVKGLEFTVSKIQDEMEDLGVLVDDDSPGILPERAPTVENRLIELVSNLCYLRGEASNLLNEMIDADECNMNANLTALIGQIKNLEVQCRSGYLDKDAYADTRALNLTFNHLERTDNYHDEFHTTVDRLDLPYISNKHDETSSMHSFKSIVTYATNKSKKPGNSSNNMLSPVPLRIAPCSSDTTSMRISNFSVEANVSSFENNSTSMDTGLLNRSEAEYNDCHSLETPNSFQFYDSSLTTSNVDSSLVSNTAEVSTNPSVYDSPYHLDASEAVSALGRAGSPDMKAPTGDPSPDCDTAANGPSTPKNTKDGLCDVGVGRADYRHGDSNTADSRVADVLAPYSDIKDGNQSRMRDVSALPFSKHTPLSRVFNIDILNEEADTEDDNSNSDSSNAPLSNLSAIRDIVLLRATDIYNDDDVSVVFRQDLVSEDQGEVLVCELVLTNKGDDTIEQLQFDFLNFENFPIHLLLLPMPCDVNVVSPKDSMEIRFKLYTLAPFIGLPKVTIHTKFGANKIERSYTLFLPVPISSFLFPELCEDVGCLVALKKQSKCYFFARNAVEFDAAAKLVTLGGHLTSFQIESEPRSHYLMATFSQHLHDNRGGNATKHRVLIKLECSSEPKSFSMYVYSDSERLAGAVAQLYRYLLHNKASGSV